MLHSDRNQPATTEPNAERLDSAALPPSTFRSSLALLSAVAATVGVTSVAIYGVTHSGTRPTPVGQLPSLDRDHESFAERIFFGPERSDTCLYATGRSWSRIESPVYPQDLSLQEHHLFRWDGSSWSIVGKPLPPLATILSAYEFHDQRNYAGFILHDRANLTPGIIGELGYFESDCTWHGLGKIDQQVYVARQSGSNLMFGGEFSSIDGVPAGAIATWNGERFDFMSGGVKNSNGPVNVFGIQPYHDLWIVAGQFDRAGDVSCNGLAAWNGTRWQPFGTEIATTSTLMFNVVMQWEDSLVVNALLGKNSAVSSVLYRYADGKWAEFPAPSDSFGPLPALQIIPVGDTLMGIVEVAPFRQAIMTCGIDGKWKKVADFIVPLDYHYLNSVLVSQSGTVYLNIHTDPSGTNGLVRPPKEAVWIKEPGVQKLKLPKE